MIEQYFQAIIVSTQILIGTRFGMQSTTVCRNCSTFKETVPHVVSGCPRNKAYYFYVVVAAVVLNQISLVRKV